MEKIQRTSAGLCDALFEELDMLRSGKSNPARAASVSKLAVQIINTKRLEIDAASFSKNGLKFRTLSLASSGVPIGRVGHADK